MGAFLSRLFERLTGVKEVRLLMLGLDNAGKTTILYKLKFDQTVTTVPTVGFNVECLMIRNVRFNVWDVGGQDKIRPLWRHYFTGTNALVFVIDSQDRDRLDEARQELARIMMDREMRGCWVLIFANKQDLDGAMSVGEITDRLGLVKTLRPGSWMIQPSCATNGEGLTEGFNWLAQSIRSGPKAPPSSTPPDQQ